MKWPLIFALMLSGCTLLGGGPPVVTTQPAGCSSLIPTEWEAGVPLPPYPGDTIGAMVAAYNVLEGLVETANDRTKAAIGIQRRCEERDAAAVRRATRRGLFGR